MISNTKNHITKMENAHSARQLDLRLRRILGDLQSRFQGLYRDRLMEMVVYGSWARGDAEPHSDIDVLVVLKGPVDCGAEVARTGRIVADISLKYCEVVSCVFMDEHRFTHRNGPLLRNIRREGVVV